MLEVIGALAFSVEKNDKELLLALWADALTATNAQAIIKKLLS